MCLLSLKLIAFRLMYLSKEFHFFGKILFLGNSQEIQDFTRQSARGKRLILERQPRSHLPSSSSSSSSSAIIISKNRKSRLKQEDELKRRKSKWSSFNNNNINIATRKMNKRPNINNNHNEKKLHFHVTYWMFYPFSEGKAVCVMDLGFLGSWPIPSLAGTCLGTFKEYGSHVGDWEHVSLYFQVRIHPFIKI